MQQQLLDLLWAVVSTVYTLGVLVFGTLCQLVAG